MLTIRARTDDDIDEAARVHVSSWQSGYARIVPAGYLATLDPAEVAARWRSRSVPEGGGSLVADEDGRIVGLASYGPYRPAKGVYDPAAGELYAIYVDPRRWGAGVGHRLYAAVTAALTKAGFPGMRLWVLEANDRARRFYERAGMRPDGERELWAPPGTTAELPELRYARDL